MEADRIAQLLPEVYRRAAVHGTPLATILQVMEDLQAPVEDVLADVPQYFDPQRAPERFVPFLAHWVDLARWLDDDGGFAPGVGRLRQVVAAAPVLSRARGTVDGLRQALEWATGVSGVRIGESSPPRPFHVVVTVPHVAEPQRELIERIVRQEKPAHVTAEIVFVDPAAPAAAEAALPAEPAATGVAAEPADDEIPTLPVAVEVPAPPPPMFDGSAPPPVPAPDATTGGGSA